MRASTVGVLTGVLLSAASAAAAQQPTTATAGQSLDATAYFGWAFDQFAPDSTGGYPPNTVTSKSNRALFGVNFDYRVLGNDKTGMQLWLAGETMHGVRSADIDCAAEENKPPVCNPAPGLSYARAVLADATSLEAYIAPSLRLAQLQRDSSSPTDLYVTARFGFVALDDAPRVFKNHHLGGGLRVRGGPFEGSSLEMGWGNNEMLSGLAWKRFKVDGTITFPVPKTDENARFFIQMFIDNDLRGSGPDSIQTFMGVDFDIRKFFGG
jgi:hypothetical protein